MYELRIALQKAGRLHDESIKILKNCGIDIDANLKDKLKREKFLKKLNGNIQIFFLRDDDIPKYVQEGVANIGIVGKNVVCEQKRDHLIREYLDFGFCRLSLAVHKESLFSTIKDLVGKCIATSYPILLKNFLNEQLSINHQIMIHKISGSVEIAPSIGIADAICDLVSTGNSLFLNDLKEIQKIFYSQAVLISYDKKNFLLSQIQAAKKANI